MPFAISASKNSREIRSAYSGSAKRASSGYVYVLQPCQQLALSDAHDSKLGKVHMGVDQARKNRHAIMVEKLGPGEFRTGIFARKPLNLFAGYNEIAGIKDLHALRRDRVHNQAFVDTSNFGSNQA